MTEPLNDLMHCALPKTEPKPLPAGLGDMQTSAIVLVGNKWINGTDITYFFKDIGANRWPKAQKQVVQAAFAKWKAQGIGLTFTEVANEVNAILKIGFVQGDGSWSYVGTDVNKYQHGGRNMNFGWDLTTPWGHATALHEIGHAIGMPHEHQSPLSGIVWNEANVLAAFKGPPNNWSEDTIHWNILRHLSQSEVQGSSWDPKSIMHYPFEAKMIQAPAPWNKSGTSPNTELSANDIAFVQRFYPPLPAAPAMPEGTLVPISDATGDQADFSFTPTETRDYRIQAVGEADIKLALSELAEDGVNRMLRIADDSGKPVNAAITAGLEAGKVYTIHARTYFAGAPSKPHLVML
ncbi:M12 family metallopeptidase [Novosphingobium beihaiensis]|uniref:M12 family metallopeptidase n=1 Tax=Novosphingobium beihaiensis TaxID=2930389 RepID=A0ABT0BST3_9SPHN|nr:M12 family metallopeptidase [Novosphingobium beihaiensis]MCJ2188033.1 M12 family metallopeptidase [Novosphingobium beihaiensis]